MYLPKKRWERKKNEDVCLKMTKSERKCRSKQPKNAENVNYFFCLFRRQFYVSKASQTMIMTLVMMTVGKQKQNKSRACLLADQVFFSSGNTVADPQLTMSHHKIFSLCFQLIFFKVIFSLTLQMMAVSTKQTDTFFWLPFQPVTFFCLLNSFFLVAELLEH